MAITFNAAGAGAGATNASFTPGLPAGFATDDIHILVINFLAGTIGGLSGWTSIVSSTVHRVYWRRAVGGDTAPTITGGTSDSVGRIYGFRGCDTTGSPFDVVGATTMTTNSTTVNAPAITTLNANSMIVFGISWHDGASTASSVSGWSGTNPTFADGGYFNFAGVDNVGVDGAYGIKTDVSTTGARTATLNSAADNWGTLLSLRPLAAASSATVYSLLQWALGM